MRAGFLRGFFGVCAMSVAVLSFAGHRNPLIQPKVYSLVERAERAALLGEYSEAIACTEAVMLKPVVSLGVDYSNLSFQERFRAANALHQATKNWEEILDYEVQFEFVDLKRADIRFSYSSDVRHLGREVAGSATWSRQIMNWGRSGYTSRVKADIQLRTTLPSGENMPDDALLQTSMHELGHVFGLWDSAVVGEVMGPLRVDRAATQLSSRELAAVRELRDSAFSIWQTSLAASATR